MTVLGKVSAIWRYPVKGMAGEPVVVAQIGAGGIAGDRQWAVRETARREVQSCKRHPRLLECVASYASEPTGGEAGEVRIRFPDGGECSATDPDVHTRLSRLLGTEVTLERLRPASDREFYRRYSRGEDGWREDLVATFTREPGEPLPDFFAELPPEVKDFVSAPGSFFLVTPLHLLTTASLRQLREWNATSDWNVRRFRPNLVIDTAPELSGLVEQSWIGQRLQVADLVLDCVSATPRCGAITRAQGDLPFDAKLLRTVVREANQNVGVYGTVARTGTARVGDELLIAT
jgi:uncharacterized protein YcbX